MTLYVFFIVVSTLYWEWEISFRIVSLSKKHFYSAYNSKASLHDYIVLMASLPDNSKASLHYYIVLMVRTSLNLSSRVAKSSL